MIKKIKKFFRERKAKKKRRIAMQREVLETLASICLYIDYEAHYSRNRCADSMRAHYNQLKIYSDELGSEFARKWG